ncbi:MAG: response regulator [Desulfobulbaceae bacterium]|nr:response regulator [Desulfobulbaceae bacterium]
MTSKDSRSPKIAFSVDVTGSPSTASGQNIRQQAEELLRGKGIDLTDLTDGQGTRSPEEVRQIFHELQVHQIELEMQNEELRRMHAEMDIVQERYFDLYNLAPVGYCTLNKQGGFLEVNLTAATMLGVARGELAGQPISRFILKEDQDIYYLHWQKLFQTGEPQTFELRLVKEGGSIIWTTLAATAAQDADGAPSYRLVISDITARKKAQQEKALLEIKLKKEQRMKSVGRLAGGVAHDFNNMLGVILGYTDMALSQLKPGQSHYTDFQQIRKAAERSADITRQLLAFASKQIVEPQILDLNQTVEQMCKALRQAIGENIELAWLPGYDLWRINMDPVQVGQILANLCVNARESITDMGKITIKTENTTLADTYCVGQPWLIPGDYVQLTVSDNGCGIDKEMIENLFEPFFTTKEISKGAGLGLATVYGAIKQNKGFINVTSEPEQGTTFTIYLPRYGCAEKKVQAEEAVQKNMSRQKTILLVEDEPIVLEMVTRLLEFMGYHVFATSDAHEAIAMAQEQAGNLDLLLTDVIMPEMNGDVLAQKLLARDPALKCLFMSGYTADVITHRGLLDEDINFIQKPFAIDNLKSKLQEVLKTK